MRLHRFVPALILIFALPQPSRADDVKDEIRDVLKAYSVHYNEAATETLAALYAPDAYWIPAFASQPIQGRKGIALMYGNLFRHSVRLKRKTLRIDVSGDLAYAVGTYSNDREYSYESFVLCLRRQADGQWLIVSDISNKSPAQPGNVLLEN